MVAWVPPVEELRVITFPAEPTATKSATVVVVFAGKVTVLGPLMVMVLNVLAPVIIVVPVPLKETVL